MKKLGGKTKYIAVPVGLVVSVVLIVGILSLTLYRGRDPITMLNGVVLRDLHISQDMPKLTVDLNLSVKNPNKYAFSPTESTAFLLYRGVRVGEAVIEIGKIPPGATKSMIVTLTILAERMQGNPAIHMDVAGGMVPFNTITKISGKVKVFRMFGVTVDSTGLCRFDVDVKSKTLVDAKCA